MLFILPLVYTHLGRPLLQNALHMNKNVLCINMTDPKHTKCFQHRLTQEYILCQFFIMIIKYE